MTSAPSHRQAATCAKIPSAALLPSVLGLALAHFDIGEPAGLVCIPSARLGAKVVPKLSNIEERQHSKKMVWILQSVCRTMRVHRDIGLV
jgi:hypothetical protein